MPIVGFNFDRISVDKKVDRIQGGVQVRNNIVIKDVKKETINTLENKKDDILKLIFEFSAFYEPKIGSIVLNGHLLYKDGPAGQKKILDEWLKSKKIPSEIMAQVINVILVRCNIKAFTLAQDVNLPPHLRLPTVSPKVDISDYIG